MKTTFHNFETLPISKLTYLQVWGRRRVRTRGSRIDCCWKPRGLRSSSRLETAGVTRVRRGNRRNASRAYTFIFLSALRFRPHQTGAGVPGGAGELQFWKCAAEFNDEKTPRVRLLTKCQLLLDATTFGSRKNGARTASLSARFSWNNDQVSEPKRPWDSKASPSKEKQQRWKILPQHSQNGNGKD